MLRVAQRINSHVAQCTYALRSYLFLDAILRKHVVVVVVVVIATVALIIARGKLRWKIDAYHIVHIREMRINQQYAISNTCSLNCSFAVFFVSQVDSAVLDGGVFDASKND